MAVSDEHKSGPDREGKSGEKSPAGQKKIAVAKGIITEAEADEGEQEHPAMPGAAGLLEAKLQEQAKDAARSFETAVNDAGRTVEQEAASVHASVNTSLAQAEATVGSDATHAAATHAVENSIAPPHPSLTAIDEVAALETSIAEQAQVTQPLISAEQMTASLPHVPPASLSPAANGADAAKKVA